MQLPTVAAAFNNFNSIKVRLKLYGLLHAAEALVVFQFHKGTIKTYLQTVKNATGIVFQFHKGTIKTASWSSLTFWWQDFNSIKVRLKLPSSVVTQSQIAFQFHKGTIKTPNSVEWQVNLPYFNSIKVRLKPKIKCVDGLTAQDFNSIKVRLKQEKRVKLALQELFQFHKGTIKTPSS